MSVNLSTVVRCITLKEKASVRQYERLTYLIIHVIF